MATTLFFVPGLWEGPTVFTQVSKVLSSPPHNFNTHLASLRSTGTQSPGNPSMKDDIIALRSVIKNLVEVAQKEVVLVLHSAGGFLGSEAMMGYDRKAREAQGLKGGVRGIVFVAGAVAPKRHLHTPLPFMDFKVRLGSIM
jgi:pimeloyl-ACP methyl ester carboxylesterase